MQDTGDLLVVPLTTVLPRTPLVAQALTLTLMGAWRHGGNKALTLTLMGAWRHGGMEALTLTLTQTRRLLLTLTLTLVTLTLGFPPAGPCPGHTAIRRKFYRGVLHAMPGIARCHATHGGALGMH